MTDISQMDEDLIYNCSLRMNTYQAMCKIVIPSVPIMYRVLLIRYDMLLIRVRK
jgi:hypothetical protein